MLNPAPENWLQMIDLRTSGEAKEIVRSVKEMAIENPQEALDLIWEIFEGRYKSNPQAARKLLAKLRGFSEVSTKKIDELWTFALACKQASTLMSTPQGLQLNGLNFPDMQRTVVELWSARGARGVIRSDPSTRATKREKCLCICAFRILMYSSFSSQPPL